MTFFEWLGYITGAIGLVVGGAFAFLSVYSTGRKKRQEEINNESKTLTDILTAQIDALEREVKNLQKESLKQSGEVKLLTETIQHLIKENKLLRELLENRDKESKVYQSDMIENVKRNSDLLTILSRSEKKIDQNKVVADETKVVADEIKVEVKKNGNGK